ncbi:MAG TPA: hypothetical protein VFZ65_11855 [Planctomycetota bacterium]|nr:hypothetical protein [Planctomycetota bacterium]
MRLILTTLTTLLAASSALAQCPFSGVSVQTYGQGCNSVFLNLPTMGAGIDVPSCTLQVTVSAFSGCCNTFLVGSLLALGDQATSIPVPDLGPNCMLLVDPAIVLFQPNSAGSSFVLSLPPVLPPLTVFAQGAALYFTTIGFSYDFALTAGAQLTLL